MKRSSEAESHKASSCPKEVCRDNAKIAIEQELVLGRKGRDVNALVGEKRDE